MTGKNCDLFTHKQSRSYLNHLVPWLRCFVVGLSPRRSACNTRPARVGFRRSGTWNGFSPRTNFPQSDILFHLCSIVIHSSVTSAELFTALLYKALKTKHNIKAQDWFVHRKDLKSGEDLCDHVCVSSSSTGNLRVFQEKLRSMELITTTRFETCHIIYNNLLLVTP